jgi:Tfp pilus assembly PilM family ATPase
MTGLKFWTGKRNQASDSADRAPSAGSAMKLTWQQPRSHRRFGRQLAFAFDDEAVQMAAASHFGSRVSLLNVRKTYIPRSFDSEDSRHTFLQGAIREYVDEFGGRHPTISVAVDGSQTALRTLLMPELRGGDLTAAVSFEAKRQLPFPIVDCLLGYAWSRKSTLRRATN